MLVWGIVLLAVNVKSLPDANGIRYGDVYAELGASDQANVYPEHRYVLPTAITPEQPAQFNEFTFSPLPKKDRP